MTIDPYATPTDEDWAAMQKQFQEVERTFSLAYGEYRAASNAFAAVADYRHAVFEQWRRLGALRRPVRDYVIEQLSTYTYKRPPTAKKIDPHHRPADVQQVLDDLITEGKIRQVDKGYEWIAKT